LNERKEKFEKEFGSEEKVCEKKEKEG